MFREEFYRIIYDEKFDGVCLINNNGFIMNRADLIEVTKKILKFTGSYDSQAIDRSNKQTKSKTYITRGKFLKRDIKTGCVFVYQELGTNFYRFGETQDLKTRLDNLDNSLPTTINLIYSFQAEDTV